MGLPEKSYITEEEYLALELASNEKAEYYQGQIFAMSGASINHNKISRNFLVSMSNKLKGKPCEPFGSDQRVHIPSNSLYTYPDISVFCGEIERTDANVDTATNPLILIEVLSPSTRNYDKGDKFMMYRQISSLQEYVTIDSENYAVELYSKNSDGSWLLEEFKLMEQILTLKSLGVSVSLSEIYDGVVFE